jgi:hypothetical protein
VEDWSAFLSANMFLVFFVYGFAFFTMGLVVALESRRRSQLPLAQSLVYLAVFGILTGIAAWMDMIAAVPGLTPSPSFMPLHQIQPINCFDCHADPTIPAVGERAALEMLLNLVKIVLFVVASLSLCQFGLRIIKNGGASRRFRLLPLALLVIWLLSLIPVRVLLSYGADQWLINAGVLARYILLLPSSILVAVGLWHQRSLLNEMELPVLARCASWAALFFVGLALFAGLVVPPAAYFPANILNYSSFFAATGVPVQVVRALTAVGIAYYTMRILRVFTVAHERRLEFAIQQRLTAQQEALEAQQQARVAIEELNRDLEERVQTAHARAGRP